MLSTVLNLFKSFIFKLFLKIAPVKKNKIIFNSFCGKGYGDSPKYIADEILRRSRIFDLVWMVNKLDEPLPKGIRPVLNNSKEALFELATSKVIICNVKHALVFKKKKKQYYIQTWHGSFGLKYIEKDAQDKLSPNYLQKTIADSKNIDLLLSSSNWQTDEYKRAFWYDGLILEKGFPRNDIFFNLSKAKIEHIKSRLNINANNMVLLYAPTFRKNHSIDVYNIDLGLVKAVLESKTKKEWTVLVRLHPNISFYSNLFLGIDYLDVTSYIDGQEILAISDVLITDYSSNMIDYILMDRPVFLFAPDIQEYNEERGLKPVYFKLPFQICRNNKELEDSIKAFEMESYKKRLIEFKKSFICYDQGTSSKQVVDIIYEKTSK